MEVQDGFIVGIYNYCDRWCETCAFTSRCRVFADIAEFEAAADPNLQAVVDAPPLPQDVPAPPPKWLQECIDEWNEAAREAAAGGVDALAEKMAPDHKRIEDQARAYSFRAASRLQTAGAPPARDHQDPRSVILWYCAFIPAKVYRALTSLASREEDEGWPADHDGSAKVALLAIERSRAAWIDMAERGLASATDVEPFVSELGRLADVLDEVFPRARAFVRPGLDEPDEVAKLA